MLRTAAGFGQKRPLKAKEQNMPTQCAQRRRTWLLFLPVHITAFLLQWLPWQLIFVEHHPITVPAAYVVGSTLALGIFASLAPVTWTILLMLIGYGPRALTGVLMGVVSGTISHLLFRSWLLLGLPQGDLENWQLLFVQQSIAFIFVVGIYAITVLRAIPSRAA
jgi:hypothetical protein